MTEVHGKRIAVFVPAAELQQVSLQFGRSEHRPLVSISIGIVFALVGLCGLIYLILAPAGYRFESGMIAMGLIGGSLIHDATKQRFFLEVSAKKAVSRLVFSKHAQLKDIQALCHQAKAAFGYEINESL